VKILFAAFTLSLVASCSVLDKPVYVQPVSPETGMPIGEPVAATNPDGSPLTVGDQLAATVEENAGLIAGTGTALGGPAGGALGGLAALLLAGVLRNRKGKGASKGPTGLPPAA